MGFAKFMASPAGRLLRVIGGLAIISAGLWVAETPLWTWVLVIVGLIPLATGVFNICIIGPLLGASFSGKDA